MHSVTIVIVFTAVRFFDTLAYAATFLQRDPLYVITFEDDPATPIVLGELDVSGFSKNMQSINQDNTLILTIGMGTDDNEIPLGLQLSLFDTTNQTNPELVHRCAVGTNISESWSGSSAQFDFQSFRYLKIDEERGRILVPVYYRDSNGSSVDGFSVFSHGPDGIAPLFEISHDIRQHAYDDDAIEADRQEGEECYSCGHLLDRSFVIDGNIITLKGQSVRSHNLESGKFLWGLNLTGSDI